jgi:endonuclease YncB( thermonuclease family)
MPDRVFWSSVLYGAFLALALAVPPCASWAADSWQGKVVRVVDGATLDIAKPDGQVERVKLYALRVPAPGQRGGDDATKRTTSWSHQWDDVAEVLPMGLGKDGQPVARVVIGREDIAEVLTRACLAIVDMRLCRERDTPECVGWQAWELQCKDEKKGLWAQ